LQFSWANTLIDPTSVELRFLSNADKLEVLDTTFPQDKPQMLYWNVQSDFDGEANLEITYFTSGITWSADYLLSANLDEGQAGLEGFVKVSNSSGEEYENAQVRLVVGTINLVEKIAQLARIPMSEVDGLRSDEKDRYRQLALRDVATLGGLAGGPSVTAAAPPRVIKEGLSEYFVFTIEGTQTIPNGWSKRLRSIAAQDVPLKIQYRYRPQEYGEELVRMYLLTNDKESKLGTTPMPDGVVRVFRDNGHDGLSYLVSRPIKYVPIGDKIELNLGPDPEVIFELVKLRVFRDELWMKLHGMEAFRRVDDVAGRIAVDSEVVGWDEHAVFSQRIRNYSAKPIDVEIRRSFPGHVVFSSSLNPTLHDYQTVQLTTTVDAGKRTDLLFEVLSHEGRNHKQDNVTLQNAQIQP